MASSLLLQAQQRLFALRTQLNVAPNKGNLPKNTLVNPAEVDENQEDFTMSNAQERLALYRQRDNVRVTQQRTNFDSNRTQLTISSSEKELLSCKRPLLRPVQGKTVRHYPDIGIAALNADMASIYRVWLACRYLDTDDKGWVAVDHARQMFTDNKSPLRLFGWRRMRQVMGKGNGRFWQWDKQNGRLWLFGVFRIVVHLKIAKLVHQPIALPLSAIVSGVGGFKAHSFGAWHSGRKHSNPISRQTQERLTGIPERTQRHYCRMARIERHRNFAIGTRYKSEDGKENAWRHGQTFEFVDKQGRIGKRNGRYVAWQMPNSYVGAHTQTAKGRMRKINSALKDLVTKGAQGNDGKRVEKLYHADGGEAARVVNRGTAVDAFWPMRDPGRGKIGMWSIFFSL